MQAPAVQHAEFIPGSLALRVPDGAPCAFTLPDSSPDLARAYLQSVQRARPGAATVDVTVVLDGSTAIFHGPPTCWDVGVAQRVQRGELRLGILRVCRAGSRSTAAAASSLDAGEEDRASRTSRTSPEPLAGASEAEPRMRGRSTSNAKAVGSLAKILSRPLKVGTSYDLGGCAHMEDATLLHQPLGGDFAFCGVFDGHGGKHAAQFSRDNLHFNVMAASSFYSGDQRAALRDGFRKTEVDLIAEQSSSRNRGDEGVGDGGRTGCCGTTALLMLLSGEQMHIAWLGDCRAVLCRGGTAVALTEDHSLTDAAERARAIADGGRVESNRLGGYLEVARALGDFDHTTGCKPPGLSAQPEIRSAAVGADDEFVVLASDGLWGVVRSDDAVRIARAELAAYDGDAGMASEKLIEHALKRHADDNVSVMVVCLNLATVVERAAAPRERPRLVLAKRSVPPTPPAAGATDGASNGGALGAAAAAAAGTAKLGGLGSNTASTCSLASSYATGTERSSGASAISNISADSEVSLS